MALWLQHFTQGFRELAKIRREVRHAMGNQIVSGLLWKSPLGRGKKASAFRGGSFPSGTTHPCTPPVEGNHFHPSWCCLGSMQGFPENPPIKGEKRRRRWGVSLSQVPRGTSYRDIPLAVPHGKAVPFEGGIFLSFVAPPQAAWETPVSEPREACGISRSKTSK